MQRGNTSAKGNTLRITRSYLRTLCKSIGNLPLSEVRNGVAKGYIASRVAAGVSGSTVNGEFQVLRKVVASVVTDDGDFVFPVQWNLGFLDLPSVKASEDPPCATREQIERAIVVGFEPYSTLVAFLGGTGLRVGEAVACRIGATNPAVTHWNPAESLISVRTAIDSGPEHSAKTQNSIRLVDLLREANEFLWEFAGNRTGFLFRGSRDGRPLFRAQLYRAAVKFGLQGYHSLRRFRVTHLRSAQINEDVLRFWIGHANTSQTDAYSRVRLNVQLRKNLAEQAVLGFTLPPLASPVVDRAFAAVAS
jgi:hypothetical protein